MGCGTQGRELRVGVAVEYPHRHLGGQCLIDEYRINFPLPVGADAYAVAVIGFGSAPGVEGDDRKGLAVPVVGVGPVELEIGLGEQTEKVVGAAPAGDRLRGQVISKKVAEGACIGFCRLGL